MTRMQRALITGVTGQDGSYLAEILLARGYEVHGIIRRSSSFNTKRIMHLFQDPHTPNRHFFLHYGDMSDGPRLARIVTELKPDIVFNLAAQSHVRVSFETPEQTADIIAMGTIRLLETIREVVPQCRYYQASSSEMFGSSPAPQSETTLFHPRSPYAASKLHAHWATVNYREAYGIHASTGILFNHESPRRGETFVTRKITMAIPQIILGKQKHLYLGNLNARRDWGHARDYMQAALTIVLHDTADDFVIGTGEDHSVQDFLSLAFSLVKLDWREYVRIDPRYFRPSEVDHLRADTRKAARELGWKPQVSFGELVHEMVAADMAECGLRLDTTHSFS